MLLPLMLLLLLLLQMRAARLPLPGSALELRDVEPLAAAAAGGLRPHCLLKLAGGHVGRPRAARADTAA